MVIVVRNAEEDKATEDTEESGMKVITRKRGRHVAHNGEGEAQELVHSPRELCRPLAFIKCASFSVCFVQVFRQETHTTLLSKALGRLE